MRVRSTLSITVNQAKTDNAVGVQAEKPASPDHYTVSIPVPNRPKNLKELFSSEQAVSAVLGAGAGLVGSACVSKAFMGLFDSMLLPAIVAGAGVCMVGAAVGGQLAREAPRNLFQDSTLARDWESPLGIMGAAAGLGVSGYVAIAALSAFPVAGTIASCTALGALIGWDPDPGDTLMCDSSRCSG